MLGHIKLVFVSPGSFSSATIFTGGSEGTFMEVVRYHEFIQLWFLIYPGAKVERETIYVFFFYPYEVSSMKFATM